MLHHVQDEYERVMQQSETSGMTEMEQSHLDLNIFDFGEYGSENASLVDNNFDFGLPDFGFTLERGATQDAIPQADIGSASWMYTDASSTLDSGLSASMLSEASETRDFDTPELTILGSQLSGLSGNDLTRDRQICFSSPVPSSKMDIPQTFGYNNLPPSNVQDSNMNVHCCDAATSNIRKRPLRNENSDGMDDDLIDKKEALRITLSVWPKPLQAHTMLQLATEFKVSKHVVLDLCCQGTAPPESRTFNCNSLPNPSRSHSMHSEFRVSSLANTGNSIHLPGADSSVAAEYPKKKARWYSKEPRVASGEPRNQSHRCTECDASFTRPADLRRHLKTHAPSQLQCPVTRCDRAFTRKDKLDDHIRRKHAVIGTESNMPQGKEQDLKNDFEYIQNMSHTVYETNASLSARKRGLGFNPVLYGLKFDERMKYYQALLDYQALVDVVEILLNGLCEMKGKVDKMPYKADLNDLTNFHLRNQGRLMARVLRRLAHQKDPFRSHNLTVATSFR